MRIEFKTKVHDVREQTGDLAWQYVRVPKITKAHCDMTQFRQSKRFRGLANTDIFLGVLAKELRKIGIEKMLRLDDLPTEVSVDSSGFLAVVKIDLVDN